MKMKDVMWVVVIAALGLMTLPGCMSLSATVRNYDTQGNGSNVVVKYSGWKSNSQVSGLVNDLNAIGAKNK